MQFCLLCCPILTLPAPYGLALGSLLPSVAWDHFSRQGRNTMRETCFNMYLAAILHGVAVRDGSMHACCARASSLPALVSLSWHARPERAVKDVILYVFHLYTSQVFALAFTLSEYRVTNTGCVCVPPKGFSYPFAFCGVPPIASAGVPFKLRNSKCETKPTVRKVIRKVTLRMKNKICASLMRVPRQRYHSPAYA